MLKWMAIVDIDVDVAAHKGWGGGHGGAEPRGGGCLGRGRPGRVGVQGDGFINVLLLLECKAPTLL